MRRGCAAELPAGWGSFALHGRANAPPSGTRARSYDPSGWQLSWAPSSRVAEAGPCACDVEWRGRRMDPALSRWAPDGADSWSFWVLAELAAKLLDMPVLEWLWRYRDGSVPLLPAAARALVVPDWSAGWTLGFACLAAGPARPGVGPGAGSPWGFGRDRIVVVDAESLSASAVAGGTGEVS
jgi:hypothetical protein